MKTFFQNASLGVAILCTFLLVINSCDIGSLDSYEPNYKVQVTVYLPEKCNGQNFYMWLLEEYKITEEGFQANVVDFVISLCPNDTIISRRMDAGKEGAYYLCALVTNKQYSYWNKFPILIPESGEYFGFYDSGFLPPDKPNVEVVGYSFAERISIYLKKFP